MKYYQLQFLTVIFVHHNRFSQNQIISYR